MSCVNTDKSYSTDDYSSWDELIDLLSEDYKATILSLSGNGILKPEYLNTVFKKDVIASDNIALFSWPSKNIVVFPEDTSETVINQCRNNGWFACTIFEIDVERLKNALGE